MSDDPLRDYIYSELERMWKEELAKQPWWCIICGAGGNYEGERPDEFLPPPLEHVCPPSDMSQLRGIEVLEPLSREELADQIWENAKRKRKLFEQHYMNLKKETNGN